LFNHDIHFASKVLIRVKSQLFYDIRPIVLISFSAICMFFRIAFSLSLSHEFIEKIEQMIEVFVQFTLVLDETCLLKHSLLQFAHLLLATFNVVGSLCTLLFQISTANLSKHCSGTTDAGRLALRGVAVRSANIPINATHCRYFVMDILGPSLTVVRRRLETKRLNRVVGLAVAEETLKIIQTLHELGIVHRDIKPSNFLLRPRSNSPLCLIDFGLAKRRYACSKSSPNGQRRFTGTMKYASPNAHKGMELGPRDDLYSWFYSMIELMGNNLPWEGVNDQDECLAQKTSISLAELCANVPEKFHAIYGCILGCPYEELPNYKRIFDLLNDARIDDQIESDGGEWQALLKVFPEAVEIVPQETEQLGPWTGAGPRQIDLGDALICHDDSVHCAGCLLL
jgi:hypothetical protein